MVKRPVNANCVTGGCLRIGDFQWPKEMALWFAKLLVIIGLLMSWKGWELSAAFGGAGALFGLVGWSFHYFTKKWSAWCKSQEGKTESQLEQEALDHPFQTEYENSPDFQEWAGQFFDSPWRWKKFRRKYEVTDPDEINGDPVTDPAEGAHSSPPPSDQLEG